jgi:hypothetical protein
MIKMKRYTLLLCVGLLLAKLPISLLNAAPAGVQDGRSLYEVKYVENPPYGVMAWSQSDLVRNTQGENRFMDYNSESARNLILDATAERSFAKSDAAAARDTTFHMVYNDRGIYLYVKAEEPQINELLDSILDPASPGHHEAYEIFLVPGLYEAPYYQIFVRLFGKTSFYDWGMPHRDYRSLEKYSNVESLPLEDGIGTFVFIPWEAWYERIPVDGATWRFTIIRWMPFGQAGGVTWGGRVHDTGNFGLLRFEKPTPAQKLAIEKRMLRAAWFSFLAESNKQTRFWTDTEMGDPVFFETVVKPLIDEYKKLGESFGNPNDWNAETVTKGASVLKNWMEFDYLVSSLRTTYLKNQLLGLKN